MKGRSGGGQLWYQHIKCSMNILMTLTLGIQLKGRVNNFFYVSMSMAALDFFFVKIIEQTGLKDLSDYYGAEGGGDCSKSRTA